MAAYRCQVQAYQLEAQEVRSINLIDAINFQELCKPVDAAVALLQSGEFVYVAEDDLQPLRTRLQGLGVQV